MRFVAATLALVMILGNSPYSHASKKQEPKAATPAPVQTAPTFDQQYFAQVDKANVALQVYGDISCTNIGFRDAEANARNEFNKLVDMYRNIPESEDQIVKAKQIEVVLGMYRVAQELIEVQSECLRDNAPAPSGPAKDNPNNDKTSFKTIVYP